MKIPQTNPRLAYLAQREEIDAAVASVLDSERYILGAEVGAFEAEFAAFVGLRNGIGVANGTDALHLALRAVGVEPGDIVVTVANTAVATAAAIEMAGARVAFVDVDDDTLTMNANALDAFLRTTTEPVRAVVPVHLYGRTANMPEIVRVARQHGVAVVEDCAQAHGASFEGQTAGTFGAIASFSFYPTKNLGAIGDGGAVLTNDAALADKMRLLRQYGWRERDRSIAPGFNSRLDELQAAILRVKLRRLAAGNDRRRAIAARYDTLADSVRTPLRDSGHVYHQYVVRTPDRDALRARLQAEEITTLVHYPTPIHQQPGYEGRVIVAPDGLPVTERAAHEILSLPMFPQLSDAEVARVCAVIGEFARV
jgi:dTDP-4-amino-4,6-dideoxygalactose transaminase